MKKRTFLIFMSAVFAVLMTAAIPTGLQPGVAMAALPPYADPGGVPHYFGPYGNWAFSPLPKGPVTAVTIVDPGAGYTTKPAVTIDDAYLAGVTYTVPPNLISLDTTSGAISIAPGVNSGSILFVAPVVTIASPPSGGTDAIATAILTIPPYVQGQPPNGIRKFVDRVPLLGPTGANTLGQYIPVAVPENRVFSGQEADYYEIALVEYKEKLHSDLPPTRLRGYVQLSTTAVPGGQIPLMQIDGVTPILKPDGTQALAVDYPHYLGPIIVAQGRVHGVANTQPTDPGYPKPARIKFYNLLPAGAGGNLFLPTDETVAGAGYGPSVPGSTPGETYTQNRATVHLHGNNTVWISDGNVHQWITPADQSTSYPKGVSVRNVPDMLDANGNVECDVAPAGKTSSGCQTFFYTNAQSARLQFYHDHAMAITRLNVYAGEAAGYVLTDAVDQDMINGTNVTGVNPGLLKVLPDIGIPLVIQDKTFVEAATVFAQDPTWNWGTGPRDQATGKITAAVDGDLWYPHVYMTVQNPADLTGTNAFGRWHYGPWFNPPVPECIDGLPVGCIEVGPVPNEYYGTALWEPPMRPGVPNPSLPGESFLDTQLVNGTAYPYLEVEPKAYRFRVLNASNDRFVNLQLYVAADKKTVTTPDGYVPGTPRANVCIGGVPVGDCTEVNMVPVSVAPVNQLADTPSGIPDPATKGPEWILIGTEGGFMPKPVVVPQQPVGYNLDMAYFAFGIVNQHSLFLGSAERADVVVDFSQYAGKTLILYNDSPAPVPAGAAPYDFYTGNGNQMDGGGAPNTQPGYGPNTRTVMQIRVTAGTPAPYDRAALEAVFAKGPGKRGVFEVSQDPIIIPQEAYNSAYNATFPTTAAEQYIQIGELSKTFQPINENGVLQPAVTMPLEMKAMHDEMGGVYDTLFGRMSGMLGVSLPNSPNHVLIPYGLASPPTDLVKGSVEGVPIGVMPDGTQIWRIFHNGVDTHTIHTHLFHTQLINRVDQSGQIVGDPVDPIEHGWKDTFRVNPLEVTYLAMRPTVPTPSQVPFEVPDSIRLIDPTLPEGATLIAPPPAGWFDPDGVKIAEIQNHYVNFGWEYVWHCHILSHEEMDMMHSLVFAVPPTTPTGLSAATGTNPLRVTLTWTDNSLKESRFAIQRATDANFTVGLTAFSMVNNVPTGPATYSDTTVANNTKYWYRVFAMGTPVGDTQAYPGSAGFPTMSADSVSSNIFAIQVGTAQTQAVSIPSNLTVTVQAGPQVRLRWTDNSNIETGFKVERCTGATCTNFVQIATTGPLNGTGLVPYFYDTTVTYGNTYRYRVWALGGVTGQSRLPTNIVSAAVPAIPAAPTSFTVGVVRINPPSVPTSNYTATLGWAAATNPTNFTIQRATNLTFTTGLASFTASASARSLTQTVARNTTYYYRIRANNNISGSSAWKNALPFPIRTGP